MAYQTTKDQERWAINSKKRYGRTPDYYLELIRVQEGRCAFSGVTLFFDSTNGTPIKGGHGCHPIYAALDHTSPGTDERGHGIVSYALNDIKGHLPHDCFVALAETAAWQRLMTAWQLQARLDASDRKAFYALLKAQ